MSHFYQKDSGVMAVVPQGNASGKTEFLARHRQLIADSKHVLVGAVRSAVSAPLAMLGKLDQMPQVWTYGQEPDGRNIVTE